MKKLGSEPSICVIGASTGGPLAIASLLRGISTPLNSPIVVVQHIGEEFIGGLRSWLQERCCLDVRLAKAGEPLEQNVVYLPSSSEHLMLSPEQTLEYRPNIEHNSHAPAIDVFFESVALNWVGGGVGVLLTGMGSDGARGLKLLRDRGFTTIAQDEESSVVWGMPKAAVKLGAAKFVLGLDGISCIMQSKLTLTRRAAR